ncbi:MAG: choice-of-anchor E domain-containing protein [Phycisphaeraceae bacterium]|nr:MAG: choice-of-anchor E domain-containing protein [Phycisphaeraceae bacterium]
MKSYICTAAVFGICCSYASAGMIVQSGSLPLSSTNWSEDFQINQFDDMGGLRILEEVCWTLTGYVEGTAAAESMDAAPATINLTLSAIVSLSLGMTTLDVVLPLVMTSFNATAFDGVVDFAGTSGATFSGLSNTDSVMNSTMMVAPFIGPGMVTLTGAAEGASTASGAGNLVASFSTNASMEYEIVYKYSLIPTPGAAALFGIAGLSMIRRRRA